VIYETPSRNGSAKSQDNGYEFAIQKSCEDGVELNQPVDANHRPNAIRNGFHVRAQRAVMKKVSGIKRNGAAPTDAALYQFGAKCT